MNNQPICEKLWYLIGVPSQYIDNFAALTTSEMAEIRILCSLRSTIIANFMEINQQFCNHVQLCNIPQTAQLVDDLLEYNIEIVNAVSLSRNVMELNKLIDARVEKIALDFGDVPQEWIQDLFRMPDGDSVDGVRAAVRLYRQFKNYYPYQKYINWSFAKTPEEKRAKNIFRDDKELLEMLEEIHANKTNVLSDFIGTARDVVVIVDSGNSDAQRIYEALQAYKHRLKKIIIIEDKYTDAIWDALAQDFSADGVTVEHDKLPRLKEQKSLVELRMVTKTCEERYQNNVRRFIFASSNSDVWALITSLPDAEILVLAEKCKSSVSLIDALTQHNVPFVLLEEIVEDNSSLLDRYMYEQITARLQKLIRSDVKDIIAVRVLVSITKSLRLRFGEADFETYLQWTEQEIKRLAEAEHTDESVTLV